MAIGLTKVGSTTITGSDTIVVPITSDVAESDPLGGATILLAYVLLPESYSGLIVSITDDAPADGGVDSCIFADGLNHYSVDSDSIYLGLIVNPLLASLPNNVTLVFDTVASFMACNLYAITGVDLPISSAAIPPDFLNTVNVVYQQAEAPVGGGSGTSIHAGGIFSGGGGALVFTQPFGATDEGWDWVTGELALYFVSDNTATADELGWTWADGGMTDFDQFDYNGGDGHFYSMALGTAPVTPGAAALSLAGDWGSGGSKFFTGVVGSAFISGPGPFCVPPPATNFPVFNRHFRAA